MIGDALKWCDAHPYKAAVLTGIVLAFCHPFVVPGSGGPPHLPLLGATVAWVALIPLLRTIDSVERKRDLIAVAYLSFGLQLAVSVYWLDVPISRFGGLPHIVAVLAIVAIALITGAYVAVGFLAARWTASRLGWSMRWVLPFFWLSTDFIRGAWIYGYPLSGFPWAHLSATQVEHPLTRQLAAIAGIDGIGLWLFAVNAAILSWLEASSKRRATLGVAALVVPALVWGVAWTLRVEREVQEAKRLSVGIVQGNLSQDIKNQVGNRQAYMLKIQRRLTDQLARQNPDVILWSEVTYPSLVKRDEPNLTARDLGYSAKAPAPPVSLIGASVYWMTEENACSSDADCALGARCRQQRCLGYNLHNSLLALDHNIQLLGRSDKHNLVPFGEYVPGEGILGLLGIRQLVPVAGRMRPAEQVAPVKTPVATIGGLICYEGVFPEIPLRLRLSGANLLVNPTNDTWYGRTSGPWQHLAFYRFRAVETGLSVVRSANSGISGWFDPAGREHDLTELDTERAFVAQVPVAVIETPWVVTRGVPGLVILWLAPALLVFAALRRRRNDEKVDAGETA